jgi:hypothetical protein
MEDFAANFLTHDAIRRFILYACSLNTESADPVTDTFVTVMTEEVRYVVSRHGLTLFRGASPLPFTHMTAQQRHLIYEVVSSMRCEVPTYSAFARLEDPLTFSVENQRIVFHVKAGKLDHRLVLGILADLVATSKRPSRLLLNIMLQRLGARVHIAKDVHAHVAEQAATLFAATEPAPAQSQQ